MTSVRRVLLETLAPAGGGKAQDRIAANPDGTLTVTPDAPDWGSPIDQLSSANSPTGFLEEEHGSRPSELFGKFTWRIDNFAEISKRELRSHQFEVGDYKWYILVYPQGCDVCNHLSLFLCVADYDKLLPGWSHFAQFTIAVVNKDPKKSKYSDTLHRFCKKEHDWGWKKFMERGKLLGGFSVGGGLVIKAQVQVILDRPSRPFRCLDAQYRRELVRVYLTNVEALCRRACEEQRAKLAWLRSEGPSFAAWWRSLSSGAQQQLTQRVPGAAILKGLVRAFFNEKEVTSSLVMDGLFCGCKQLEALGRGQGALPEGALPPCVVIDGASGSFSFALDALEVVAQLGCEDWLPACPHSKPLPLGAEGLSLRSGCGEELSELRRDVLLRDEARLAGLGRRAVELFALVAIFTQQLERAYRHHQAEVRMADLIAEEEAQGRLQDARAAARAAAEREKRAKKKERQKARKEAEQSKRDAEAAQLSKQQQQQHCAEQDKRQGAPKAGQQQQQQVEHAAAAGAVELSEEPAVVDSDRLAAGLHADHQQQQQQQQEQQSSKQQSGAAGSWAPHISSSSAGPASAADSGSDSSSDGGSDSGSAGSSSSKGFVPVQRHQQQRQRDSAAVSQHGAGGWGATHNMHNQPRQPQQQQQQQHTSSNGNGVPNTGSGCSSGTSTPIGYAAAVAGMRPPPPAEVTAAAIAMAEQQRQLRELQEQAAALKQQVTALEAAVRHRDALLAQKDQEAAELKQQLSQQAQQVQELRKQAADWRAAAAAAAAAAGGGSSSSSSRSGAADVKSFAAVAAAGAADGSGSNSRGSRGSSRSRGASVDLSDAAAPASWSAVAAGAAAAAAAAGRPAATAAGAAGSISAAAEQPALQAAELPASVQRQGVSCNGSSSIVAGDPATPVAVQQKVKQLRPSSSSGGNSSEPDASSAAAAEGTLSSSQSSHQQQAGHAAPGSSELTHAQGTPLVFNSSSSSSSSDAGALAGVQLPEVAGPGSMSSMDAPVSPRDLAWSISASAPGPVGSSSVDSSTAPSSSSIHNSSSSSSIGDKPQHHGSHTTSSGSRLTAAVRLAGSSSSSSTELSSRAVHVSSSSSCEVLSSSLPGLAALRVAPAAAAAAHHAAFLGSGIAGAAALQCGSPLCGDGSPVQLTPSYSSAAAGSGSDMAAAGATTAQGTRSSSSSKSKLGPGQQQQQQQHAFAGFGSQMAAGSQAGMFAGLPAANDKGGAAAAAGPLEDLDGFVHMNMIDDLLSGLE